MADYQDLKNFVVPNNFRIKSKYYIQLWWVVNSLLFKSSPQFMYGWRRFLLRLFGAKIGKGVLIRSSANITYPWNVEVGEFSWIGDDCVLYSLGKIKIGCNVSVAHKVYFNTGGHDYKKITFDIFTKDIEIKDECWITTEVYIAPGVTVGKGAVIGARSTVLVDMPEGMVCVGYPAKPIKARI